MRLRLDQPARRIELCSDVPYNNAMQALHRPNWGGPILKPLWPEISLFRALRLVTRLRGAAAPAARCGSGQWRRVGSPPVVPPGGSSEAISSGRLRIDWNNRRALVRVTLRLSVDPDPGLSWSA